jgi:hypothetical protein
VDFLKDELMRLKAYIADDDNKYMRGNAGVSVLVSQIRDAAYDAQNVIERAGSVARRNTMKKGFLGALSRYAQR